MSVGQNGQTFGGPSDCLEDIAVLNQDFFISIQNALKKSPKECLAPLAMDYLQFLYTIIRKANGSKFKSPPTNDPVNFTEVALFFQTMNDDMSKNEAKKPAPTTTSQSAAFGIPSSSSSISVPNFGTNIFNSNSTANMGPVSNSTFTFSSGGQNSGLSSSQSGRFSKQPTTTTITFGSPALNSAAGQMFGSAAAPISSTFGFAAQNSAESTTVNGSNNQTAQKDDSEDDAPPVPDFVPVVETDALCTQRIKLFSMVDKKYTDLGVGNLFVKKLNDGKCQVVIRADNSLGKILLNVRLNSSFVLELKPPNNIIASVPVPDKKPNTYVIRVKTNDEAKELFKTLEKYKLGV